VLACLAELGSAAARAQAKLSYEIAMARDREDDGAKGELDGELSDDDSSGARAGWLGVRSCCMLRFCRCMSVHTCSRRAAASCSCMMPLQSIPCGQLDLEGPCCVLLEGMLPCADALRGLTRLSPAQGSGTRRRRCRSSCRCWRRRSATCARCAASW
jgi:hypothetical protein